MSTITGAELLVRALEAENITILPGIPGGSILPFVDAVARSKLRVVLARHEQGAGFIAAGMARSTGRAAACFATSGPGATNLLTALADAHADSVPLVAIAGQVPTPLLGTNAFQEVDLVGLALPITKYVFQPRSAAELLSQVREAFVLAESGRPGPVLLDVPRDVQTASIELRELDMPRPRAPSAEPRPELLEQAAAMMREARRPILLLGGGANSEEAGPLCQRLAERWDAPIVCTLMGLGTVSVTHPLFLGMLGMHGALEANRHLFEADLVLAMGTRFGDRMTGKTDSQCPNARLIHVDIDPSEQHKIHRSHLSLLGDVAATAKSLEQRLGAKLSRGSRAMVAAARAQDPNRDLPPSPRDPRGSLPWLAERMGPDTFVVTDVGQHQMRVAQSYPFCRPRHFLTSGGLGTMGFGLPAALGAALANPSCPILCVTGDGSLMMNVQELATMVEEQANVIILCMDNGSLGLVRQQQTLFFGGRHAAADYRRPVDILAVARAFGVPSWDLGDDDVEACFEAKGPRLLRLPVDADDLVWPMVPPGAPNIAALTERAA